jgi:glutaredoxin
MRTVIAPSRFGGRSGPKRAFLGLALLCLLAAGACKGQVEGGTDQTEVVDSKPVSDQLPPLRLLDDTKDLLLTWIDAEGEFHVVERPADVPAAGRSKVRVVLTSAGGGTGRLVYVADLDKKNPDGSYVVETMTRAAWNELGAERRKVRLEALLERRAEKEAAPVDSGPIAAAGKTEAIIYGADWCKPCHQAEDYLKSLGVAVTKKDIEKSPAARSEMEQKLSRAGQAGASIPVIDVMGQLFVGYNRGVLRRAVERSLTRKTL